MKEERFFYVPDVPKGELPEDEARHAARVLRLREDDTIFLIDGKGAFYKASITDIDQKCCRYLIKERSEQEKTWGGRIHLAIAPTKMADRIEWLVEKATEIGFDEITFLNCRFSERKNIRIDRIEKIVIAAMKQSRKAWKPKVNEMVDFQYFIKNRQDGSRFIAHCYQEDEKNDFFNELFTLTSEKKDQDVTILIGPEGDFAVEEVKSAAENGFKAVSLGKSRLRTETAGLAAVMMANLAFRKL